LISGRVGASESDDEPGRDAVKGKEISTSLRSLPAKRDWRSFAAIVGRHFLPEKDQQHRTEASWMNKGAEYMIAGAGVGCP